MNSFFSLTNAVIASNTIQTSHPYKLTFAVTYRCNSRCQLCNIWKRPQRKELSLQEITKFFSKNNFHWIDITGGEIFLRRDITNILTTIIQKQPSLYLLHMPTNGLLSETIFTSIKEVLTYKPRRCIVTVSLDGPKLIHDKLRGIRGSWERAIKTYQLLSTLRSPSFSCYFGMTVSGYNAAYLEQTFSELRTMIPSLKRTDMHFNLAHTSSHYYGNENQILNVNGQVAQTIPSFTQKNMFSLHPITYMERIYQRYIPKYLHTNQCPLPCKSLISSVFLNPYGVVYPCSMWNHPLGNVQKMAYRLDKILTQSKTKSALQKIHGKNCPHCWTPCEAYQTILGNLPRIII